jgi:hypothetical protein
MVRRGKIGRLGRVIEHPCMQAIPPAPDKECLRCLIVRRVPQLRWAHKIHPLHHHAPEGIATGARGLVSWRAYRKDWRYIFLALLPALSIPSEFLHNNIGRSIAPGRPSLHAALLSLRSDNRRGAPHQGDSSDSAW